MHGGIAYFLEPECQFSYQLISLIFETGFVMFIYFFLQITFNKGKLVIADLILQDAGNYMCNMSNVHGYLNWTYELEILRK